MFKTIIIVLKIYALATENVEYYQSKTKFHQLLKIRIGDYILV